MNIQEIITQEGIIYDRYLDLPLNLPYSDFEFIKIKQNDTVTNFNINNVITKLYSNFLYLYKSAHIASNIIPYAAIATAGVSGINGTNINWYSNLKTSRYRKLTGAGIYQLDTANTLSVVYNNALSSYSIFLSNGPNIQVFNSNNTFTNIVTALSSNFTFDNSGVHWQGVSDFAFGENNTLYVLDVSANSVTKYDASGFLINDNVLQNTLLYQNSIGGFGTYNEKLKFNAPSSILYHKSEIYVLDSGNSTVKKYDKNLNWVSNYQLFRDLLSSYPVQLTADNYGSIYLLTLSGFIYKYDDEFTTKQVIDISNLAKTGETIKRLSFSLSDSNVFYIITNKNVYKKLVNYPEDTVGFYLFNRFNVDTDETITAFATISANINGQPNDLNFIFSNNNGMGKLSVYQDNLNVLSILTDDSIDVYSRDEINIHPEEYLQNWVFNKAISKLLINHMRLRDNITSKFLFKKDAGTGSIFLSGSRYLLPDELNIVQFQQDISNYIGMNEILQNNIINRPFEKIFNIQKNLLKILNTEVQNYLDPSYIITLG